MVDKASLAVAANRVLVPAFRIDVEQLHEIGADLVRSSQNLAVNAAFPQPNRPLRKRRGGSKEVVAVARAKAFLGGKLSWYVRHRKLYWVDILGPALHVSDPATLVDTAVPLGRSLALLRHLTGAS